jgi:hypothetical protein
VDAWFDSPSLIVRSSVFPHTVAIMPWGGTLEHSLMRVNATQLFLLNLILAAALGCAESKTSQAPAAPTTIDFSAQDVGKPLAAGEPAIVLVVESHHSGADDRAWGTLQHAISPSDHIATVVLDISDSQNREIAARFHPNNTPLLVCMSAKGVIVSRDKGPVTSENVHRRVSELMQHGPELDAKLAGLQKEATQKPNDPAGAFAVAEFLLDQKNCREAVRYLDSIAHSDSTEVNLRLRAWIDLCRAHDWIGHPEKAAQEARDLIATLGEKLPQAKAGGELVLGTLDAAAKHMANARKELHDAIAAAPDSEYAQEAAIMLTQLPTHGD